MVIHVEFFGLPRDRAGVAEIELPLPGPTTLRLALQELSTMLPEFAEACCRDDLLLPGYIANINGGQFVRDPHAELADGSHLLIMSADAGG